MLQSGIAEGCLQPRQDLKAEVVMLIVLEKAGAHRYLAIGRHAGTGGSNEPAAAEQVARTASVLGPRIGDQQKGKQGACKRGSACRSPASGPGSGVSVSGQQHPS